MLYAGGLARGCLAALLLALGLFRHPGLAGVATCAISFGLLLSAAARLLLGLGFAAAALLSDLLLSTARLGVLLGALTQEWRTHQGYAKQDSNKLFHDVSR